MKLNKIPKKLPKYSLLPKISKLLTLFVRDCSIGRRGYASYMQEMFTLEGDEFEALTAADSEPRGGHD